MSKKFSAVLNRDSKQPPYINAKKATTPQSISSSVKQVKSTTSTKRPRLLTPQKTSLNAQTSKNKKTKKFENDHDEEEVEVDVDDVICEEEEGDEDFIEEDLGSDDYASDDDDDDDMKKGKDENGHEEDNELNEFAHGEECDNDDEKNDIDLEEEEDDNDYDEEGEDQDMDFEKRAELFNKKLLEQTRIAALESQEERLREDMPHLLVTADGEQLKGLQAPGGLSTGEIEDRIKETLHILSNFKNEREEGHTRQEYLKLLRDDLQQLFEYNDYLLDVIMEMFAPQEAYEFMEAMEKPRPTTIRANTIKCKRRDLVQALIKLGVNVEPLEKWSKVGLQIFDSNVPIAGTVQYLAGHYMLQSAVSFLPVMALAPQEHERVLDMSAAPGGKTTYIAQLMKNTGVLFANDINAPRIKSLNANIQRLGVTNCITTNYDGVGYYRIMNNFDRVLLDAPCTGTGIISRDKSIKTKRTLKDVQRASQLQRMLIISAIDCCKPGGVIVYSTCSFLVEENEAIIDYTLRQRFVEVVEMGLAFGRPGYTKYRHMRLNAQCQKSRRFFPHVHNMDGFYVCKLRKIKNGALADATSVENITAILTKNDKKFNREGKGNNTGVPVSSSSSTNDKKSKMDKINKEKKPQVEKSNKISIPPKVPARTLKRKKGGSDKKKLK